MISNEAKARTSIGTGGGHSRVWVACALLLAAASLCGGCSLFQPSHYKLTLAGSDELPDEGLLVAAYFVPPDRDDVWEEYRNMKAKTLFGSQSLMNPSIGVLQRKKVPKSGRIDVEASPPSGVRAILLWGMFDRPQDEDSKPQTIYPDLMGNTFLSPVHTARIRVNRTEFESPRYD